MRRLMVGLCLGFILLIGAVDRGLALTFTCDSSLEVIPGLGAVTIVCCMTSDGRGLGCFPVPKK